MNLCRFPSLLSLFLKNEKKHILTSKQSVFAQTLPLVLQNIPALSKPSFAKRGPNCLNHVFSAILLLDSRATPSARQFKMEANEEETAQEDKAEVLALYSSCLNNYCKIMAK